MGWIEKVVDRALVIKQRKSAHVDAIWGAAAEAALDNAAIFGDFDDDGKKELKRRAKNQNAERSTAEKRLSVLDEKYHRRVRLAKVVWFGSAVAGVGIAAARILGGW